VPGWLRALRLALIAGVIAAACFAPRVGQLWWTGQPGTDALSIEVSPDDAPTNAPRWTPTRTMTPAENALSHFRKHRGEFPEYRSVEQYINGAHRFVNEPPKGTLTKIRRNGDRLFYDPETNTFAVQRADGALRTMFRPARGIDYWNRQ
jgi:pyocin large subunit-like protein